VKIQLHIGKLVLDGLPVSLHSGTGIGKAVEEELARLLRAQGLTQELQSGCTISGLSKTSLALSGSNSPSALGSKIARSVFTAIGRTSHAKPSIASRAPRRKPNAGVAAGTGASK
jgi:hypothetical protein